MDFQRISCFQIVFAKHMPQTKKTFHCLNKNKCFGCVRSGSGGRGRCASLCLLLMVMMVLLIRFVLTGRPTRGCAGPHAPHQPPPPGAARAAPAAARGLSRRKRRASRHAGRPAFVFSCGSHRHASCSSPPGGSPHTAARPTSGSLRRHDLAARATWRLAPPSSASPSSGGSAGETNSRGGT